MDLKDEITRELVKRGYNQKLSAELANNIVILYPGESANEHKVANGVANIINAVSCGLSNWRDPD